MNTKKLNLLFVILLTLILVGAGCGDSDQVGSPAGDDDDLVIGGDDAEDVEKDSGEVADVDDDEEVGEFEGWTVYSNEQWGLSFKYPKDWNLFADDTKEDLLNVYLHPYDIPKINIETDFMAAITLLVKNESISISEGEKEIVYLNNDPVEKYVYHNEPQDGNVVVYLWQKGEFYYVIYAVSGSEDLAQSIVKEIL